MSIKQIAEGFYNRLVDKEQELYKERIAICKRCAVMKVDDIFGPICSSTMYINPKDGDVSSIKKPGYNRGDRKSVV